MTNRAALLAVLVFAALTACSKEAPAPAPADDDEETTPAAAAAPEPARTYDYAKMATGMLTLIDTAPQCQTYRDQLEAIAKTPAGQPAAVEPSAIVAQANDAGCAKK